MRTKILFMALMFALPGQVDAQCFSGCGSQVYVGPPAIGHSVVYAPPLYNNIHFDGQTRTKQYVRVRTKSGGTIEVPVINGILPRYNEVTHSNGAVVRNFYYNTGVHWKNNGRMPTYSDCRNHGKQIERKDSPKREEEYRGNKPPAKTVPDLKIEKKDLPFDDGEGRGKDEKSIPAPVQQIEKKDSPGFEELKLWKRLTSPRESKSLGESIEKQIEKKDSPSVIPIVDPNNAIHRNASPKMIRPSEIK